MNNRRFFLAGGFLLAFVWGPLGFALVASLLAPFQFHCFNKFGLLQLINHGKQQFVRDSVKVVFLRVVVLSAWDNINFNRGVITQKFCPALLNTQKQI